MILYSYMIKVSCNSGSEVALQMLIITLERAPIAFIWQLSRDAATPTEKTNNYSFEARNTGDIFQKDKKYKMRRSSTRSLDLLEFEVKNHFAGKLLESKLCVCRARNA